MSFRVGYPVGNTAIRDCQYWPTLITDEEDFPDITQATLMQMAWRVREWTVSEGSFSFTGTNPFSSNQFTMEGEWDEFIVRMKRRAIDFPETGLLRDVTDEQDILGPNTDSSAFFPPVHTLLNAGVRGRNDPVNGTFTEPDPGGTPGAVPINAGVVIFDGYVLFNPDTQLFTPPFDVFGGGFTNAGIAPTLQVSFGIHEFDGSSPAGGMLTVIDPAGGADLVMEFQIGATYTAFPAITGTGVVSNVTMTPTKWWPYKDSQGLPVWDENSGAQLRDPFG